MVSGRVSSHFKLSLLSTIAPAPRTCCKYVQLQPVKHSLHKSPSNKTYSLDRISKQQWNNASSQGASTWRNWNNGDDNWLVASYGTLWCQLADTEFPGAGCTSAVCWCLVSLPQQATEQIRLGDDDAKRNRTFRLLSCKQHGYSALSY